MSFTGGCPPSWLHTSLPVPVPRALGGVGVCSEPLHQEMPSFLGEGAGCFPSCLLAGTSPHGQE